MSIFPKKWFTLGVIGILITACSSDNGGPFFNLPSIEGLTDAVSGPVVATVLSTATVSGQPYTYERIKLSSTPQRDTYIVYFKWPQSGPVVPRPTVLITRPYEGFDWSQDAKDIKWSTRPNAVPGYAWNDEDSIGYAPVSGDQIPYKIEAEASFFGDGFFYLLAHMNVAFVYNRYYGGETFVEHARDTALALRYLSARPEVDATKIGVNGLSWGGMTAALGTVLSGVPVKAMVLQSPLLDLKGINDHFTTFIPANVASPSQQTVFAEFYRPYARRIRPVFNKYNPPAVVPLMRGSTLAPKLSNSVGSLMVLASDWDTLVPFADTKAVLNLFPAGKAVAATWTHATPIDYETFPDDHNPNAGTEFSQSVVMTRTQAEFADQLLSPSENVVLVLYSQLEFYNYLTYMRDEKARGVNVSHLLRMFLQMSRPNVSIYDQGSGNTYVGALVVANLLNSVWGGTFYNQTNVYTELSTNGLPL